MLNDKRNALEILRFGQPERVVGGLPCHGVGYLGVNHESLDGSGGHEVPVGTTWTDVWGTTWHKELPGVMGFPRRHPIDSLAALAAYSWPDPDDERLCGRIYTQAAREFDRDALFLGGSHRETLWEKAYMLCGMERLMAWLLCEPGAARDVLTLKGKFQTDARTAAAELVQVQAYLTDSWANDKHPAAEFKGPRLEVVK